MIELLSNISIRDCISLGGFLITILTVVYGIGKTTAIKDNHLKHVSADLLEIKNQNKDIKEEVKNLKEEYQETKSGVRSLEAQFNLCKELHNCKKEE